MAIEKVADDHLDRYEELAKLWNVTPAEAEKRDKELRAERDALVAKRHAMSAATDTNPLTGIALPAIPKKDAVAAEPSTQ